VPARKTFNNFNAFKAGEDNLKLKVLAKKYNDLKKSGMRLAI